MTSNRRTKKLIRSHMGATGLCYLEAKRSLEVFDSHPRLGKLIAVASSRSGAGKTSISIGLASYLARASEEAVAQNLTDRPLKVLLLDLDLRDGQVGIATGFWKPTVMRLHRFGISTDEIESTKIYSEKLKIDLLLSPRSSSSADELTPDFYDDLLAKLKPLYDYIIMDTSVSYLDPLFEKVVYPLADEIILATDPYAHSSMARWLSAVAKSESDGGMGISRDKIKVVANGMLKSQPLELVSAMSEGLPVVSSIPAKPKLFARALGNSQMEMIFEDRKLRRAFGKVARSVAGVDCPLADFE